MYVEQADPVAQDAFFAGTARAVVQALQAPGLSGPALARTLVAQARAGRISVWSPQPEAQRDVEALGVSGERLADPTSVGVFLNDSTGAKMQYFLAAGSTWSPARRAGAPCGWSSSRARPPGRGPTRCPTTSSAGPSAWACPAAASASSSRSSGPTGDGPAAWRVDGVAVPAASTVVDGRGAGALGVDVAPGARVVVEVDLAASDGLTGADVVATPGTEVCTGTCP